MDLTTPLTYVKGIGPARAAMLEAKGLTTVEDLLGYVPFPTITEEPYSLTIAPYSFLWLELQPASEIPEILPPPVASADAMVDALVEQPAGEIDLPAQGWAGWIGGHGAKLLATALADWLPRQRWFGAKTRVIQSVRLLDWVELTPTRTASSISGEKLPPALFFIEVHRGKHIASRAAALRRCSARVGPLPMDGIDISHRHRLAGVRSDDIRQHHAE